MRRLHLIIGLIALDVFVLTGLFMRTHMPPMITLSSDVRLMYRSRHIYLLAAALLNVLLGVYLTVCPPGWRRSLQQLGSVLFMIAPVLVLFAFVSEPDHGFLGISWRSYYGVIALFAGSIAHLLSAGTQGRSGVPASK